MIDRAEKSFEFSTRLPFPFLGAWTFFSANIPGLIIFYPMYETLRVNEQPLRPKEGSREPKKKLFSPIGS